MLDEILGTAIGFVLSRIGAAILWLSRFGTRPYKQFLKEDEYGFIPHAIGFAFLFVVFLLIMFFIN